MATNKPSVEMLSVDASGSPLLSGMKCETCGHIAFPEQSYGCEKCGENEYIHGEKLACIGHLTSFATVHLHHAKNVTAPFIIGEVRLESGPTIRITMVESVPDSLSIGAPVNGIIFRSSQAATEEVAELRFQMMVE
jgi:uncharacterized OB-fold protein